MNNPLLMFILESFAQRLREHEFTEIQIDHIARQIFPAVETDVCRVFGGERVYVAKRDETLRTQIAERFTGNNVALLVRELRVSRRSIYRAIQKKREKQCS